MEFGNPIVGTEALIRSAIKSPNYEAGIAGWIIRRDGTAEFQDIIARGDVTADRLSVPFVNQNDDVYTIDIGEANVDQPGMLFEFDGVVHNWDNGSLLVEAFDAASGWGETTWKPLQPDVVGLGGTPNIRIQSHRANGQGGRIDFLGSTAFGDGSADDRPLFQVGSSFDILMEALRHEHVEEATDLALAATGVAQAGDGLCALTSVYPRSGIVTVSIYIRGSNSAAQGITSAGFEIRDTNAAGTVRHAFDGNKVATIPRNAAAAQAGTMQYSEVVDGLPTSGVMFIRPIYIGTNASTATYIHRTLDIIPSP